MALPSATSSQWLIAIVFVGLAHASSARLSSVADCTPDQWNASATKATTGCCAYTQGQSMMAKFDAEIHVDKSSAMDHMETRNFTVTISKDGDYRLDTRMASRTMFGNDVRDVLEVYIPSKRIGYQLVKMLGPDGSVISSTCSRDLSDLLQFPVPLCYGTKSHHAQGNWNDAGKVKVGGIAYDRYQFHNETSFQTPPTESDVKVRIQVNQEGGKCAPTVVEGCSKLTSHFLNISTTSIGRFNGILYNVDIPASTWALPKECNDPLDAETSRKLRGVFA